MDAMVRYRWAGNVRELENEIKRMVALADDADMVSDEMLSEHIRGAPMRMIPSDGFSITGLRLNDAVDALKQQMILEAIEEMGNKTRAAEKLGIPRQSLQKMMKRLGLKG